MFRENELKTEDNDMTMVLLDRINEDYSQRIKCDEISSWCSCPKCDRPLRIRASALLTSTLAVGNYDIRCLNSKCRFSLKGEIDVDENITNSIDLMEYIYRTVVNQ